MTFVEAETALQNGNVITHQHFSDDEYLYQDGWKIRSEEGYNFNNWWDDVTTTPQYSTGWSIKEGITIPKKNKLYDKYNNR